MSGPVSGRDARALAIGGLCMTLMAAVCGLPAVARWNDAQHAVIEGSLVALSEARQLDTMRQALLDSMGAMQLRIASLDSVFVPGARMSTAVAAIAGEVAENAQVAEVRLEAIEADSVPASARHFRRLRVRGAVTGDLAGLLQFLVLLEGGPRLFIVHELTITSRPAAPNRTESVRATFIAEGLMRQPPGSRTP